MNASEGVHSFFFLSSLPSTSRLLVRKIDKEVICLLFQTEISVQKDICRHKDGFEPLKSILNQKEDEHCTCWFLFKAASPDVPVHFI